MYCFSVTRTSCPDCSLPFNRPSLLLKHMLRVHSKCTFTASIDTKVRYIVEDDRKKPSLFLRVFPPSQCKWIEDELHGRVVEGISMIGIHLSPSFIHPLHLILRVSFSHHRQSHSVSAVNDDELIPIGMIPSSSRGRVVNMPSPQEVSREGRRRGETKGNSLQEVVVSSDNMKGTILDDEYHIDQNAIIGADGTIEVTNRGNDLSISSSYRSLFPRE